MAQSGLATALSGATNSNFNDFQIYNNVVGKMSDPQDLPTYKVGMDFKPYGQELMSNPDLFNGYLSTLVSQFGVIFQKVSLAKNPLNMFKKGLMPFGGQIESIVYDTVEQKEYNPFFRDSKGHPQSPFEQNLLNPDGGYYQETQDISTPVTIIDTVDTRYFQNLTQFHNYVYGKIASLVNGAMLDEFYHTKLTLSKPIADGKMPLENIHVDGNNLDDKAYIPELAKKIKTIAKEMRYFSRNHNADGINQATLVQNIVVMVPVKYSIDLDMSYFGQLFNPENARDFQVQYVEVDNFPTIWKYTKDHVITEDDAKKGFVSIKDGPYPDAYAQHYLGETLKAGTLAKAGATDAEKVFDGDHLAAVILDRDALQIWDQLPITLSTVANPRARYNNVFLNKKAIFAYITGLNAEGIYVSDNPAGKLDLTAKAAGTGDAGKNGK